MLYFRVRSDVCTAHVASIATLAAICTQSFVLRSLYRLMIGICHLNLAMGTPTMLLANGRENLLEASPTPFPPFG